MQASDDYIVQHNADNNDIVLFLFKTSSAISATKRKVCCVCGLHSITISLLSFSILCSKITQLVCWVTLCTTGGWNFENGKSVKSFQGGKYVYTSLLLILTSFSISLYLSPIIFLVVRYCLPAFLLVKQYFLHFRLLWLLYLLSQPNVQPFRNCISSSWKSLHSRCTADQLPVLYSNTDFIVVWV